MALQPAKILGQGQAQEVLFDPSGRWMAIKTTAGVTLYDAHTWQTMDFPGAREPVTQVAFSPDGSTLALAASNNNKIQLWQLPEGRLLQTWEGEKSTILGLDFFPTGEMLAASSFQAITVFAIEEGSVKQKITPADGARFTEASISADGSLIAAPVLGATADRIAAWDAGSGEPLASYAGEVDSWFIAGAFATDGDRYGAVYGDEPWGGTAKLLVWDVLADNAAVTLNGPADIAGDSWIFLAGGGMATGHVNGDVVLWSSSGQQQTTLSPPETTAVQALRETSDGQLLAVVYSGGQTGLWSPANGTLNDLIPPPEGVKPVQIAIHPDNRHLAMVLSNGLVRLWDMDAGQETAVIDQHTTGAVRGLAFAPDSGTIASGSANGMVRLWDSSTGEIIQQLPDHGGRVDTVAYSANGELLASGVGQRVGAQAFDDTIRIWQSGEDTPRWQLDGEKDDIAGCTIFRNRVAFTPDGSIIAATSHDFSLQSWLTADGSPRRSFSGHEQPVLDLAISPNGETIASASQDGAVRLWHIEDGTYLGAIQSGSPGLQAVAFSPDGSRLAGGSFSDDSYLWDVQSRRLLRRLEGSINNDSTIAFSTDGSLIAAGSGRDLNLWSANDGRLVRALSGDGGNIISVAFATNGRSLAFGSESGAIHLWELP